MFGIYRRLPSMVLINLDFADVKAIMSNAGSALMGWATSGDDRAVQAAQQAIRSRKVSIDGAKGVLINVTGGYDMVWRKWGSRKKLLLACWSNTNIILVATFEAEMER